MSAYFNKKNARKSTTQIKKVLITRSKRKQDADKRLMIKFQFARQHVKDHAVPSLSQPACVSVYINSQNRFYIHIPKRKSPQSFPPKRRGILWGFSDAVFIQPGDIHALLERGRGETFTVPQGKRTVPYTGQSAQRRQQTHGVHRLSVH